jgi:hypothetical protein
VGDRSLARGAEQGRLALTLAANLIWLLSQSAPARRAGGWEIEVRAGRLARSSTAPAIEIPLPPR